ncbi:MAG TPA: flavodoxin domain-containing protein [Acidobacteriota bacterium]|nr:flavodoxin domain-containing protein [Acidobacteriota bacterium]
MPDNVLVVYFSKGGASQTYAEVIAETLREEGLSVNVVNLWKNKKPDVEPYDCIVVGTGVRIGWVYRKGKMFLKRDDLKRKRLAIFLSSGIAVEDPQKSKDKFLTPLIEKYGLSPILWDALPGKIPGEGGKLEDKTDPELAKKWAQKLSRMLRQPQGCSSPARE